VSERLLEGLGGIAPTLTAQQIERLAGLAELVVDWGARINLSGFRDPDRVFDGLIADALALGAAIDELIGGPPPRIVDLGSGAGFPGLPLAITRPATEVVLVESRQRRHHFQRAACRELGITNAHPRLGRIEGLDVQAAEVVVAQAVGQLADVVGLAGRWVAGGGWLVVPGGSTARRLDAGAGWASHGSRRYGDGVLTATRTLWYARRGGAPPPPPTR